MTDKDLSINDTAILAEQAHQIRQLGKQVAANIIEIGKRLADAKDRCGHGNWLPWLEREFQWSERFAQNCIQAHVTFGSNPQRVADLPDLPLRTLFLLAAPSTPEAARAEVLNRANTGERLKTKDVKGIIEKAKPSKPAPEPEAEVEVETDDEADDIVDYTPPKQPAPLPPAPPAMGRQPDGKPAFECGDPPCQRLRQAHRRHNELTDQIDTLRDKLEQADEAKALLNAMEQVLEDQWWPLMKEAQALMNKQRRR